MKTLKSMRLHIGIFGKTNVGKSSLLNRITNQDVSIVSNIAGTTTDVVEKSMELLPIGPVNFLDTAGINDSTALSSERIEKTMKIINRTDVAIVVCDYNGIDDYERNLIEKFNELKIPFMIFINKTDEKYPSDSIIEDLKNYTKYILLSSVKTDDLIVFKIKELLVKLLPEDFVNSPKIVGDLIPQGSTVILVIPIDKEAPKGRIILPQVQTLRDLLDNNCVSVVVKESELKSAIDNLKIAPSLVVTDSQAFKNVSEIVPENIPLTSFSILFARLKGDLNTFSQGAKSIEKLQDGDRVLILESCTHHAIEDDIGRVKIPNLLRKKTGKNLIIDNIAGHDFPDISKYKLIIHCGACMTNRREVLSRILLASENNVPITNYGICISYCLGILSRALKIFEV
ncbi:MAG TPA: [FeFe] hydrogenase H-cluster maturation GTPase HydF [Cyanobacteria bacterium UBA10660]|nr:MAG TPA: [FeFe] hydrogenase H-cluster maturation GTPase HydF [Candidatus Gastranaerophilales bacterium HUM_1]HAS93522.1 [FeFe] hydrogenase H-cluster maturation GTPase HydF [Cyanobacteria bacterium UBA10660]